MKKHNAAANTADIEGAIGYSFAHALVVVLKACGDNLTRENVMKQAASIQNLKLPMLLSGITVSTGAGLRPDQADAIGKVRRYPWKVFGEPISGATN